MSKASDVSHGEGADDDLIGRPIAHVDLMRSTSPVLDAALRDAERSRARSPALSTSRQSLAKAVGTDEAHRIISESQGGGPKEVQVRTRPRARASHTSITATPMGTSNG